jgi:hypothetical protein
MHTLLTLTYFSCFVTIPLQWGTTTTNGDNGALIALPIAFSQKIMAVTGIPTATAGSGTMDAYRGQIVTVDLYHDGMLSEFGLWTCDANKIRTSAYVKWIAIGV